MAEALHQRPWWVGAVAYQVYLRSFCDGDGDGLGDLRGLEQRLDHLAWLGVDAVWINPFFVSPMRDGGYDVADHCGVDPRYGTLAEFDAVVARAHDLGLRVIIDIVANHTSSAHPWFTAARASRDSPYRDYYVWRDPAPDGGPPNNWASVFGGDAWTYDDATGQYWLHLFLPEMPDLNWHNPTVAAEFEQIVQFWLARGVDGFRVDVAHALLTHPDLPDLPPADDAHADATGSTARFRALDHVYDFDQPGTPDLYRRWRELADAHGALLVGEVYLLDAAQVARYVVDQQGLHLAFWMAPLHCGWDPDALRAALRNGATQIGASTAWPLGNHDRPRSATRLGGGRVGPARGLALATLMVGLPGVPFVYQGEELGLADVDVATEAMHDPLAYRDRPEASRDPARTPLPWEPGEGAGFTSAAATPWLPIGPRTDADTVAGQRRDPSSPLHRFRALIAVRRALADLAGAEAVHWLDAPGEPVIAYRRGDSVVVVNTADTTVRWTLPRGRWTVAFSTLGDGAAEVAADTIELAADQALILTAGEAA